MKHQWVKMEVTPVNVLVDGDGDPVVLVDPDVQAEAAESAQYGCLMCDEALGRDNAEGECSSDVADNEFCAWMGLDDPPSVN